MMEKVRDKFVRGWVTSLILIFVLGVSPLAWGGIVSGVSTSELINDPTSVFDGWYKYTIDVEWDTEIQQAISHLDVMLGLSIQCPYVIEAIIEGEETGNIYFQFEPDDPLDLYGAGISGLSTDENYDPGDPATWTEIVPWFAIIIVDDPATGVTGPLVKYEQPVPPADPLNPPPVLEPGALGTGTFWFYSTFGPEQQTWEDGLVVKANQVMFMGDVTGDMPYCIPEPATICLLGLGGLALFTRKRR